jgi:hypothetical protein
MGPEGLWRLTFAADGGFRSAVRIREPAPDGRINHVAVDLHGRVFAGGDSSSAAGEFIAVSSDRGNSWTHLKSDLPGTAASLGVLECVSAPTGEPQLFIGTQGTGSFRRVVPAAGPAITVTHDGCTIASGFAPVDFGAVAISASTARTFAIINRGTAPLTGLALSVVGGQAAHFDPDPLLVANLAPGASTTFSVRYAPTAAGHSEASLRIASNDADENPFEIELIGDALSAYEAWAMGYGLTEPNSGPGEDFDRDSALNFLEFAFGTDPTVPTAGPIVVDGATIIQRGTPIAQPYPSGGGNFWAHFGRRRDHLSAGLTYAVQFSAELVWWETTTVSPTVIASDVVIDAVRVPFPNLLGNLQTPRFFRVVVVGP